jgi:hypothetical protein
MSKFDLIEIPFEGDAFEQTLEDQFLLTKIKRELENVTDLEVMKQGALKLAELAVMRQVFIRGLVKRLADLESTAIRSQYEN